MSFWAQEPSYSNSAGTVSFEGIVLNPGYLGSSGKIANITFVVGGAGNAAISFSSGSILANDGLGTNILTGFGSGSFTLVLQTEETPAPVEPPATPSVPTSVPAAPSVTSATHVDPTQWYSDKNPIFDWVLPKGVDGVNVYADHEAQTDPGTVSDGLRSSYTYTDVEDGQWYFHIRFHNNVGWGPAAHFGFNIDATAPVFESVNEILGNASTDPTKFLVKATDALSGITSFGISVDGGAEEMWSDDGSHIYTPSVQTDGLHNLIIRALDAAGNSTAFPTVSYVRSTSIVPAPTVPQLFSVTVPGRIPVGAVLEVTGSATSNTSVIVWVQTKNSLPESHVVRSDDGGAFFVSLHDLTSGSYQVWAQVMGNDGSFGVQSPLYPLQIFNPMVRIMILGGVAALLALIAILIAFRFTFILLVSFITWLWKRLRGHPYHRSEKAIHKAVHAVARDVQRQVRLVKTGVQTKRGISLDVERLDKQFSDDLRAIRKTLEK